MQNYQNYFSNVRSKTMIKKIKDKQSFRVNKSS